MIDMFHGADIAVILDWVPAHFREMRLGCLNLTAVLHMNMLNPKKSDHLSGVQWVFEL